MCISPNWYSTLANREETIEINSRVVELVENKTNGSRKKKQAVTTECEKMNESVEYKV